MPRARRLPKPGDHKDFLGGPAGQSYHVHGGDARPWEPGAGEMCIRDRASSEINQSFKVLGSEMKLVSSQFDSNDKSIQALSARNTVLNLSLIHI